MKVRFITMEYCCGLDACGYSQAVTVEGWSSQLTRKRLDVTCGRKDCVRMGCTQREPNIPDSHIGSELVSSPFPSVLSREIVHANSVKCRRKLDD